MANSISGNAGLAGALVVLMGTATSSQASAGDGSYSFAGLANGNYWITVQLAGQAFTPWVSAPQTISGANISGVNFVATAASRPGTAWFKRGIVLPPNATQLNSGSSVSGVLEPTVMFEGGAQILSGNVFKIWFTGGAANTAKTSINYAESADGVNWTQYSGNPIINSHSSGRVFKNGSTYYGYWTNGVGDIGSTIDQFTSSDGVTWTLTNSAVLSTGAAGTWDDFQVYNFHVFEIDGTGTWKAVYGANRSNNMLATGLATSPDGVVWTKSASNPVIPNFASAQIIKSGNTYYAWGDITKYGQGGTTPFEFPTDFARTSSTDLITWTHPIPSFIRTESWEGLGNNAQIDSPHVLENSGKTYMWYEGSPTAGAGTGFQIGLATTNQTLASLVSGQEGVMGFQQGVNSIQTIAAGTLAITFGSNVTAGDTILVYDSNGSSTSVTDSQGNVYTQIGSLFSGSTKLWMTPNVASTGSLTVTAHAPNASNISMTFVDYTTGLSSNPKDNVASNLVAVSNTNMTVGPVATGFTNEIVIFFGTVYGSGTGTISTPSGWTKRVDGPGANANVVEDISVASAGNTSFAGTSTSNAFGAPLFLVGLKTSTSSAGGGGAYRANRFRKFII